MTAARPRYAFSGFVLSPGRRLLARDGREVPLIPRYFDLLLLLVEARARAVTRREIFDAVWSDVVVSDGALSQAVRTLRRALGDDPREPSFIRTVSRHGYQFVAAEVVEEPDHAAAPVSAPAAPGPQDDGFTAALERLLAPGPLDTEERREAAETLHALGTARALERATTPEARALLRDTRWDVAGAGDVPLLGQPDLGAATLHLLRLRLRRALRVASRRWASGAAGGAAAGLVAGVLGGLVLRGAGGLAAALGVVGLIAGGLGALGVGAGLAAAEVFARSSRRLALVIGGALGGGAIGALTHLVAMATIQSLFGRDLSPTTGGFEGVVLGAAAGLGYAVATRAPEGGMPTPHGGARGLVVLTTGACCALAAIGLAAGGRYLGAMSLDLVAHAFPGSQAGIDPLARLLGEETPGLVTRVVVSGWEGLMFGSGLALGLTRRPQPPVS